MGTTFSTDQSGIIEVIYLEGNIGCGKSTALSYLKSQGEITVPESVQEWTFLDEFYIGYGCAFQLQTEIALSRREQLYKGLEEARRKQRKRIFVERSIKTGALFSEGITPTEKNVLNKLYDTLSTQQVRMYTEKTIYIAVDPATCFSRIEKRGRDSENTISKVYLYRLHRIFETHFLPVQDTMVLQAHDTTSVEELGQNILRLV